MIEVNEVGYPEQFDTAQNFPATTEISEASGEDINRNRDAIITIERVLGLNPHIGLFTEDPNTATVDERLDIIENGMAEGRFMFRNLNVNDVLVVRTDQAGLNTIDLGSTPEQVRIAPVNIRGPLHIFDSGLSNSQTQIDVPFVSSARANIIQGSTIPGEPILRITDTNADPGATNRLALQIEGNVQITNGHLLADFAVDHSQLLGINTIPRAGVNALHVTRGDHHSHKRKRDPSTGALLNEVDPNPSEDQMGLIDHADLLNIFTKTGQTDFIPVEGVAYHVTNGDDHDHKDGRGAPIDHNALLNVNPAISNHVTGGDSHAHTPNGDGAPIDHRNLLNIGFLSHSDIDRILNIEFRDHVELIDPTDASEIDTTVAGLGHHVPQGHVSDPNAHHTRYTDQEAITAEVLIAGDTGTYTEGSNASILNHIQALGGGIVSETNPHGLSASDVGALEGFDAQGNLPDFTQQFLENAVADILNDPAFNVLRGDENELIEGLWTFDNSGGIIIQDGPGSPNTTTLNYDRASRLDDLIAHADNTGGTAPVLPTSGQPPFHDAADIRYDPSGSTTPLVATDVTAALDELDSIKEPTLGPSNQVVTTEITDLAVTTAKIDNNAVTLAKLANPQSFAVYTFNGEIGREDTDEGYGETTDTREFGFVFPTGCSGTVEEVSVMWIELVSGTTDIDVDVEIGGVSILTTSPEEITGLTAANVPARLPSFTAPSVNGTDSMTISIAETGGGLVEVSVTVVVKFDHTV